MLQFLNMSPKKAVDLVNRHTFPQDYEKVVGLEGAPESSSKKEDQCACKSGNLSFFFLFF